MKKFLLCVLIVIMLLSFSNISFASEINTTANYDEYFSEERNFTVGDNTYEYSMYFFSNESDNGYLYSHNVDTNENILIFARPITLSYLYDESLYCVVNGNEIVKINIDGTDPQTILTIDENIKQLYANDDVIFYSTNNSIYRYHIMSQKNDCLLIDENIYFFYPYSNFIVEWSAGEYQQIKRYNSFTDIIENIDEYTYLSSISVTHSIMPRTTYNIHGTNIPFASGKLAVNNCYNSYVTSTCSAHHSAGPCPNIDLSRDKSQNCSICGNYPDDNGNTAYQCNGFGYEVFNSIFSSYPSRTNNQVSINSTAAAREFFWSMPSGSLVRGVSSYGPHTFIICEVTTTDVTIYESNMVGSCKNSCSTYNFAYMDSLYSKITYTLKGIHSVSSYYINDMDYHWKKCTKTGCNCKVYYGHHNFTANSQGDLICNVCGYVSPFSQNSLNETLF